jgi:hypothetical protein
VKRELSRNGTEVTGGGATTASEARAATVCRVWRLGQPRSVGFGGDRCQVSDPPDTNVSMNAVGLKY